MSIQFLKNILKRVPYLRPLVLRFRAARDKARELLIFQVLKRIPLLRPFAPAWRYRHSPTFRADRRTAKAKGLEILTNQAFIEIRHGDEILRLATSHMVYVSNIVSSFPYYYGAVEPVPTEGGFLVDCSTPRIHWVKNFNLMPILFPSLTESLVTAKRYVDFAELKPGNVVFDLGAYSGLTSILFAERVGRHGKVFAFEPDPLNFEIAKQNIDHYARMTGNGCIDLINKGVWEHSRGISFAAEGNIGAGATDLLPGDRGERKIVQIETITLDEFAESRALERLDFVKCNIEGSEQCVIPSSMNLFQRYEPKIIIEPHFAPEGLTTKACTAALAQAGYEVKVIEQDGEPLLTALPAQVPARL